LARSLDQILTELDAGYAPSRQLINQRLEGLPQQADAEIQGLNAQQGQAFNDILAGARDRGLGFSGIPIQEQAKYTATNFLPAVARVRQAQTDQKTSLFDALNNVNLDQRKTATGIYQTELDRDEQKRQFEQAQAAQERQAAASQAAAARAASASTFNPSLGALGGAQPTGAAPQPQVSADYITVRQILDTGDDNRVRTAINKQTQFLSSTKATAEAKQRARQQLDYFRALLGTRYAALGGR
jgi:hypothetical protein